MQLLIYPLTDTQLVPKQWVTDPSLASSLLFIAQLCHIDHPFGQCGSVVLGLCPPSFLCTLSSHADGTVHEEKTVLGSVQPCSATAKTLVCYQCYSVSETQKDTCY